MSWLRSAAIWLILTGIVAGAVWLFWGKDIETAWKKFNAKPVVKEAKAKLPKEIEKQKAELKKLDIPLPKEAMDRAKQIPLNAHSEWQKTRSGIEGLVEAQKRESTRDLRAMTDKHDSRMIEILKQVRLYKEPRPTALFPPEPTVQKQPEKKGVVKEAAKQKKEPLKKKEPLRPMI